MKTFDKQYHPPGTPPGTLIRHNDHDDHCTMRIWSYDANELKEALCTGIEQTRAIKTAPDTVTWLDIGGLHDPETIRALGKLHKIHLLALEDLLNRGQRPKIDHLDNYVFIILNLPSLADDEITIEQVSVFVSQEKIISFCQGEGAVFEPVRARLRQQMGRLRHNDASYLLYVLIDTVIDAAFPVLEKVSDSIETLEESILQNPDKSQMHTLHMLKRDLLLLRKTLWPQREVLNQLLRDDIDVLDPAHRPYFNDCHDHVIQIIDLIETYREMLNGLLDLYLSSLNTRMNDIMRVLTIIATIFIPLTFLVGVYGMNFKHMPELSWLFGYPLLWGIMLILAGGMLWLFRRNHWL